MEVNTLELKNDLHTLVTITDDENILLQVKQYFTELNNKTDWWDELSESQKTSINLGIKQLDEGKTVPHAQVRERVDKILRKV